MNPNLEQQHHSLEKPPVLYHGSANKHIEEFEPRPTTFNHTQKGEYVIGTPDFVTALPYLFSGEIDGEKIPWSSGVFSSNKETMTYVMLPCTKEDFMRNDHGGAVYSLSPESFSSVPQRKDYEWCSEEKVKSFEKKEYNSILATWEAHNITPFFLTQEQFEYARALKGKERLEYLKSL